MSVLHRKAKKYPWFEFSRAQYYLKSGESIDFFLPLAYSGGVASRTYGGTARQGKMEVLQYADATGVEPCPGIVWEMVIDETAAVEQISAGHNVSREISCMRKGFLNMVYQLGEGSTTTPYYGMKIAPHPSGFQEWKEGMAILGKFADEADTNGVDFSSVESLRTYRVEIDVGGQPTAPIEEQLTVTTHVATLSAEPKEFDWVFATAGTTAGFKTFDIEGIGGAPDAGEYTYYQTRRNTCQAGGTTTTVVLDASASGSNDTYNGMQIEVYNPTTGATNTRLITDYVGATVTATVTPAMDFSPGTSHNFHIVEAGGTWSLEFNSTDAVTAARVKYKK